MASFSEIIGQSEDQRRVDKASVYSIHYGKASKVVLMQLFDSSREVETQEGLYGVSYATWVPSGRDEHLINVWNLSEEATFESLREIYCGDDNIQRVHYVIAVDNSEICAAAVEKNVLQMEKHKKARKLMHLPAIIIILHEGEGVDEGQFQRINSISERVLATLLVLDNTRSDKVAILEQIRTLIVDTLFPNINDEEVDNSCEGMLAPLLSRRGPVMTQALWNSAERENSTESMNIIDRDLVAFIGEMMRTGGNVSNFDVEEDEESIVDLGSTNAEEIKEQEYIWLGGLKKFVADVTKKGVEGAGNSPQKGLKAHTAPQIEATDEDEDDDAAAFFQDLLARK